MHIKIGVPIVADDGVAGQVERIIVHPATCEVDGVVAGQGGMLGRDVVIPIDWLVSGDESAVRVRGTVDELSALEPFALSQYTAPPEDWIPPTDDPASIYLFPATPLAVGAFTRPAPQPEPPAHEVEAIGPDDVDVDAMTPLYCQGREVGRLDRVFTQGSSDRVTHLVFHRGTMRRDIAVPVEQVERIGDEGIYLAMTEDELDDLPAIVPDHVG